MDDVTKRERREIEKGGTPTYSESTIMLHDLIEALDREKRLDVIHQIECLLSDG